MAHDGLKSERWQKQRHTKAWTKNDKVGSVGDDDSDDEKPFCPLEQVIEFEIAKNSICTKCPQTRTIVCIM